MSTYYSAGTYKAEIVGQGITKSKTKGTAQFFLSVMPYEEILPDGRAGEIPEGSRFERTIFRAITPNTIEYLLEDLKRLGFQGESFDQLVLTNPNCWDMRNTSIDVRCEHEEYEGKTRERWSLAWGGTGYQAEPLEADGLRKLNALYGKQLKEACGNSKSKPQAKQERPQPTQTLEEEAAALEGDDIPF